MRQSVRLYGAAHAAVALLLLSATTVWAAEPPPKPADLQPGMAVGAPPPGAPPIARGMPPPPARGTDKLPGVVTDDGRLHAVISKEMEPVVAAMLPEGPAANLPGGALIENVQVKHEEIVVTVKLADGATTAWLLTAQLAKGPVGGPQKFIVKQRTGDAEQPELDAAIKKLVQVGELSFQWQEVRAKPTMAAAAPGLTRLLVKVDAYLTQGNMREASLLIAQSMIDFRRENMAIMPAWDVAVRLRRVGRKGSSFSFFDRILEQVTLARVKGPMPAAVWQRYAGALQARGRTEDGRAAVKECMEKTRGRASTCGLGQMAEVAALDGDLKTAAALLDEALAKPGEGDELLVLDRVALARRMGQNEDALRWAKVAAQVWPKSKHALATLASAEIQGGQAAAGVKRWLALFEQAPNYAGALAGVADGVGKMRRAELEQGAARTALDDLSRELSTVAAAGNDLGAFGVAMARYHRGELETAFGALTRLLKKRPKDARVHAGLALAAYWLGHVEAARRHAENAVKLAPGDPSVYLCRSVVRRPDDLPGAATDLERHIGQRVAAGASEQGAEITGLNADLEALKAGNTPPDRLRPQGDRTLFGRGGMPAPWLVFVGLVLLTGVAFVLKRKGRTAQP